MKHGERAFNWCLGFSVLGWGVLGLTSEPGSGVSPVRICITLLAALVGVLVIVRRPLRRGGTTRSMLLAIPSFLTAGVLFKLAPHVNAWPVFAQWTFVLGTAITVTSMAWLGRSFAILPAVRRIVARGPYRWIRHPIYMGEFLLIAACVMAAPDELRLVGLGVAASLMVIRIRAEEEVLMGSMPYQDYVRGVAWRLVPGVW
jgi:protein-S-isoprenylcysteine O-methyltransferase Ste14